MRQNIENKVIQQHHASRSTVLRTGNGTSRPSHTDYVVALPVPYRALLWCGIRARMLRGDVLAKMVRGLKFTNSLRS